MQLSKHFTLKEMTKSMTATRKGIDNTPGPGEIKNLGDLCYEVLEPLRAHFDKPDWVMNCDNQRIPERSALRSNRQQIRHRSMHWGKRLT